MPACCQAKHRTQSIDWGIQQTSPLAAWTDWQSRGNTQSQDACKRRRVEETFGDEDLPWWEQWCSCRIHLPQPRRLLPLPARSVDDAVTVSHRRCLWHSSAAAAAVSSAISHLSSPVYFSQVNSTERHLYHYLCCIGHFQSESALDSLVSLECLRKGSKFGDKWHRFLDDLHVSYSQSTVSTEQLTSIRQVIH